MIASPLVGTTSDRKENNAAHRPTPGIEPPRPPRAPVGGPAPSATGLGTQRVASGERHRPAAADASTGGTRGRAKGSRDPAAGRPVIRANRGPLGRRQTGVLQHPAGRRLPTPTQAACRAVLVAVG